jgi:phospholipase A-2-activating protein
VLAFTKEENVVLNRIFVALNAASPDPASTTPVKISRQDAFSVLSIAARWPVEDRFPIIDLARLVVAHAPSIVSQSTDALAFAQTLLSASGWTEAPWPTPLLKTLETNILLALRGIANIFQPPVISALGNSETAVSGSVVKASSSGSNKQPHQIYTSSCSRHY